MLEFTKDNKNLIGVILGLSYTLYFNWQSGQYPFMNTIAYCVPFLLISILIGIGISKIRKDNNYGIYFAVISLVFILI